MKNSDVHLKILYFTLLSSYWAVVLWVYMHAPPPNTHTHTHSSYWAVVRWVHMRASPPNTHTHTNARAHTHTVCVLEPGLNQRHSCFCQLALWLRQGACTDQGPIRGKTTPVTRTGMFYYAELLSRTRQGG